MKPYTYKGKVYRSLLQLTKTLDLDYDLIKCRLKLKWSLHKAITTKPRLKNKQNIKISNQNFSSIKEACIYFNVKESTVRTRLSSNWSVLEAFELKNRNYDNRKCVSTVYIIKNIKNKKVYIGVTKGSTNKRFKQHISTANNKYNLCKFHKALIDIGPENFYVKVLKKTNCIKDLETLETYYISKYNSVENGYNTLKSGNTLYRHGKKIIYKNKEYFICDLAQKLNISRDMLEHRIKNKLNLELKNLHKITVTINNQNFDSLAEVARKFKMCPRKITQRYKIGLRDENLIINRKINKHEVKKLILEQT